MALVFRNNIGLFTGKGSNLTPGEVDTNFHDLHLRVFALEDDPPEPNGIANIIIVGATFKVVLDDATELGPYALPIATFAWRDAYAPATAYFRFDVLSVPDAGLYLVLEDHVSPSVFDENLLTGGNTTYHQLFGVPTDVSDITDTYPAIEHAAFNGI